VSRSVFNDLLKEIGDAPVKDVLIGTHWTAVVTEAGAQERCGLASSQQPNLLHDDNGGPAVPEAGLLQQRTSADLAKLALSSSPPEVSVGMATINALLPHHEETWVDLNAEAVIADKGADKRVALVGHFPFVRRLRRRVKHLSVLELRPRADDLPAHAAPDVIPEADIVALTSLTLLNGTFEGLMRLCHPGALVLLLGPTTPLSSILFDYGVHILSGSIVTNVKAVLRTIGQGGNFRQVHRAGVRLVTITSGVSIP
jgi:uncharacterized protein (DUF4213/DUF364 family)